MVGLVNLFSRSRPLSVGFSIPDEAVDFAQTETHWAHYDAVSNYYLILLELKKRAWSLWHSYILYQVCDTLWANHSNVPLVSPGEQPYRQHLHTVPQTSFSQKGY